MTDAPTTDTAWETPPPAKPGAAPYLEIVGFEGPLDWLLEQARARRIDLARISIGALVDAFETALLHALAAPDLPASTLTNWGDWLVMAADLTLLRSRLLLASDPAIRRDAETEAEALRRRLLARAEIGAAARWLGARDQLGIHVFARFHTEARPQPAAGREGDITSLLRACLVALALPPDAGVAFSPATPLWTVADAIARLRHRLPPVGAGDVPFSAFLPALPAAAPDRPLRCRAAVASTLVGVLELAREGVIGMRQEDPAQEIRVWAEPIGAPITGE